MLSDDLRRLHLSVKDAKSLSDYEEFAAKKGLKVENGVVYFGENRGATNDFYIEAKWVPGEISRKVTSSPKSVLHNGLQFSDLCRCAELREAPIITTSLISVSGFISTPL
jgi:hypothetical protein